LDQLKREIVSIINELLDGLVKVGDVEEGVDEIEVYLVLLKE
jgi:hypothetical protein